MNTLIITIADDTLRNLEQQAQSVGKSSVQIAEDLVEDVFGSSVNGGYPHSDAEEHKTIREYLQKAGLVATMSDSLRQHIRYDVTLDEVIEILAETSGSSLSETADAQRGPKA